MVGAAFAFASAFVLVQSALAGSATLELIHVEANEGGASGGHAALKVGSQVFHFQSERDWGLRLSRDSWPTFRRSYADLQNRTLHITTISAPEEATQRISARFQRLLTVQRAHRRQLERLAFREDLLEVLADPGHDSIPIPGGALFSLRTTGEDRAAASSKAVLSALKHDIDEKLGPNFLTRRIRTLEAEIGHYSPVFPDIAPNDPATRLSLPPDRAPATTRALDDLASLHALRLLRDGGELNPELVHVAPSFEGEELSPSERHALAGFQDQLSSSVHRILQSTRHDRGGAVLYTVARIVVIDRSLAEGRLFFIDPFLSEEYLAPPRHGKRRELFETLLEDTRAEYTTVRAETFVDGILNEWNFRRFEEIAGRTREIGRGLVEGTPIRLHLASPLAAHEGPVEVPTTLGERPVLKEAPERARAARAAYREELGALYSYNWISRNCATELPREMNASFSSPDEALVALGGELQPGEDLSFIPVLLSSEVRDSYAIEGTRTIPSYRARQLHAMREEGSSDWGPAREAFVPTARLYPGNPADSAFLFFSDGPTWTRPFVGVGNLGYGLLQTGMGVATLPFDGGHRLQRGARGSAFSITELMFLNLRKGRMEYVSPDAVDDAL